MIKKEEPDMTISHTSNRNTQINAYINIYYYLQLINSISGPFRLIKGQQNGKRYVVVLPFRRKMALNHQ